MSRIISYRGLLASDGQDTIPLGTIRGEIGYRVVKFQVFPKNFGTASYEAVMQIWKVPQTTPTNVVDFSDPTLLGVASWSGNTNVTTEVSGTDIIFDSETFNQDIYITLKDTQSGKMNYYIELEQRPLALDEATVATLKDIRNND